MTMKTYPLFNDVGLGEFGLAIDGTDDPELMNLDVNEVIKAFKANGALLFDNFDIDVDKLVQFSNQFSSDYISHKGGGSLREVINKDGDQTVLSVAYSFKPAAHDFQQVEQRTFPLELHSDRSYTKAQPVIMWFFCQQPAKMEGETTIADGIHLCKSLSDSTVKLLKQKRLKYIRHYNSGEWQLVFQSDDVEEVRDYCNANDIYLTVNLDESIITESIFPAIRKPKFVNEDAFVNSMMLVLWQEQVLRSNRSIVRLGDGEKIPEDVIAEIREVFDNLTHDITWKPNQMVMCDNTRMIHGRRSFTDAERRVYTRMCLSVPW